jgi:hypothetical protein
MIAQSQQVPGPPFLNISTIPQMRKFLRGAFSPVIGLPLTSSGLRSSATAASSLNDGHRTLSGRSEFS